MQKIRNLIIILGDQLSHNISSLDSFDKKQDHILMMEVTDEATYVPHHPQKLILILSAMRHFADELKTKKFPIQYIHLDDKQSKKSFTSTLVQQVKLLKPEKIIITFPGEQRVLEIIEQWQKKLKITTEIRNDDRFFCGIDEFKAWAEKRKSLTMEYFYREMRQKTGFLMTGKKPVGGKWNYDKENREPPQKNMKIPKRAWPKPDKITQEVIGLVKKKFKDHFGDAEPFLYAVTRKAALKQLDFFIKHCLKDFGKYQDAMLNDEYYLFHSMLSPYLNCGLIEPTEVCQKAIDAYKNKTVPVNSVEGFLRQILGWREYVRGIYWLNMPGYDKQNFLNAKNKLPSFYWTGETKMECMKHAIGQTKQIGHSHHIQRLMVTGNFALLANVDPKYICEWYLAVYIDAYEWVELPNTLGMVMFADGGLLASKPYAASGNYINKMSNFCKDCHFNVKEKIGEEACPFNYLYWNFLIQNQKKLKNNARLFYPYNHLKKMSPKDKKAIETSAKKFLKDC